MTPRRSISTSRPLFIFDAEKQTSEFLTPQQAWELVPADLRPYGALLLAAWEIDDAEALDALRRKLDWAHHAGVPTFLTVQLCLVDKEYLSIEALDRLLYDYPLLIGLRCTELSCAELMDVQRDYLCDVIQVAARHGAYALWSDMGYSYKQNVFVKMGQDEKLFNTIRDNRECVILSDKMNGTGQYFLTRAAVLGAWLGGLVGHWGVNPEDWWWYEMGFGEEFTPSLGMAGYAPKHGTEPRGGRGLDHASCLSMPEILFGQAMLTAMAMGATVYSWELALHALYFRDTRGRPTLAPTFHKVIAPLLRMMVEEDVLPNRQAVLARTPIAYHASGLDDPLIAPPGERLFRPLYGARGSDQDALNHRVSSELLPRTGRYFALPILPALSDEELSASFPRIITADEVKDPAKQRRLFNEAFSAETGGDACALRIGSRWFVTNTRENQDADERIELPLGEGPCRLAATLPAHTMMLVRPGENGWRIHVNNYIVDKHIWDDGKPESFDYVRFLERHVENPDEGRRRNTELILRGLQDRPDFQWQGEEVQARKAYDEAAGELHLTLTHNGPVDLEFVSQSLR